MRVSLAAVVAAVLAVGCKLGDTEVVGPPGPSGTPGPTGPQGDAGQSVVASSLAPGDANCPNGGTQLVSANATTYACNGAPGAKGDQGAAGQSVTATALFAGDDPACPAGGTRFTSASGVTYACHGSAAAVCGPCDSRLCYSGTCAKVMFVTTGTYRGGDLGGVAGADSICQTHATNAALKGSYRAWIGSGAYSPGTSWSRSVAPYVNVAGIVVGNDWSQLVSGPLAHAVAVTESGEFVSVSTWTGLSGQGFTITGGNCGGWMANDTNGYTGHSQSVSNLSAGGPAGCQTLASLLCVEQ